MREIIITNRGANIKGVNKEEYKIIKRYFTIMNKKDIRQGLTIRKTICKIIKENKEDIIIERFGLEDILWNKKMREKIRMREIIIRNNISKGEKINIEETIKLKEHQEKIIKKIFEERFTRERYEMGLTGCILKLEAGLGKSYIAMKCIEKIKRKTIIKFSMLLEQTGHVV